MKTFKLILATLVVFAFNACNSVSNDPKTTLSSFFDALAKKDFVTARSLATSESKSMLDLMESSTKMEDSKETQEKYDKSKMEFGEAKIDGDKAVVPVKEVKSGETVNFTLKKVNGSWKVAFDKMTMISMGMEKAGEKNINVSDSLNKAIEEINNIGIDSISKGLKEGLKKIDSLKDKIKELDN